EGAAAGGPGHQPPQGRVGLVPRVAADRAVLSVARAGREQRGGFGGGSRGIPDGRRVAGVRVVADEACPQAQHERDVEAVHPHRGLVAAGMDVAVPAPAGREDEVARFHRHPVPVDDHAGAAAREPEPHGGDGMGVHGCLLAGEEHLVGRRDGRGGTGRRRSEPGIAQDQRAALQASRVGRELAGPGELGIDVLPVPDVPALGASGLGELLTLPERQRGQLCQPLVIVRDIGWGKGVAHCSSSYQGYAPLRRSIHFPAAVSICRTGYIPVERVILDARPGGVIVTERGVKQHSGLPAEMSSLVGRGPQLAAVLDCLRAARVVTLTGPGGCGKTRLGMRAAALAAGSFGDGARLVELASLTDPALVPASVAEALGVPEQDAANPMAGVVRALADRELLIVLDNCEHVLASTAGVAVMLAGQCPRVRIMTTSRERLDVPGEFVFPVPSLELPEDGSAGAVAASEAGGLFVTRARAASPAFTLTDGNAAAIAEVCSRLDGMPLAIELAAARCPALGPVQLAARLGHPGLLSGGAARPGRHRSLEALVSWSYDLLDDAERRLLARLSVLRGGFDLEV